jgi:hypothetical protein
VIGRDTLGSIRARSQKPEARSQKPEARSQKPGLPAHRPPPPRRARLAEDGWTAKVTSAKLKTPVKTDDGTITDAVSEITWTGGRFEPGHYEDFNVAFGQLPTDTDQLTFKSLQTYSGGKVVRWIEAAGPDDAEPENPASVLKLTATAAQDTGTGAPTPSSQSSRNSAASASGSDSTARGLGVAGLVVGVLGLAAAVFALTRGRSLRGRGE